MVTALKIRLAECWGGIKKSSSTSSSTKSSSSSSSLLVGPNKKRGEEAEEAAAAATREKAEEETSAAVGAALWARMLSRVVRTRFGSNRSRPGGNNSNNSSSGSNNSEGGGGGASSERGGSNPGNANASGGGGSGRNGVGGGGNPGRSGSGGSGGGGGGGLPREKPGLPVLNEANRKAAYAAHLPSFREVSNSAKGVLFVKKLHLCAFCFDFTEPTREVREKEIKRTTLVELVEYVNSGAGRFTEAVSEDVIFMLSSNLFRTLPPSRSDGEMFDPDEEEPMLEPAWPHLQVTN